jgi:uncharacterized hydrophobic protein (TIGR00341 family)
MQPKIIEVIARKGHTDTLVAIAEEAGAVDWHILPADDSKRVVVRILTAGGERQGLVDAIQRQLSADDTWRLTILPLDGTLPKIEEDEADLEAQRSKALTATREELYGAIAGGAIIDWNFALFVVLSTMVAGIGLVVDSVAVVIGAMVIAPLLGPNLAFAFGAALGDLGLMGRALRTSLTGLAIAIASCALFAALASVPLDSAELLARTRVGYGDVALALASGAAAALSLTTGLPTALVGVMVAVAILPPAATAGLMAGGGRYGEAATAALLLAVNLICVNLSAQVVFAAKGIKPHHWLEQKNAWQSTVISATVWVVLLAGAILGIYLRYG